MKINTEVLLDFMLLTWDLKKEKFFLTKTVKIKTKATDTKMKATKNSLLALSTCICLAKANRLMASAAPNMEMKNSTNRVFI